MPDAITRRRFMRDAGIATATATNLLERNAFAATPKRCRGGRQTVAVFGAGIAGLTAAHELAERGFDVSIYERRAWGGKARSLDVPNTATGGRRPLPNEHSFRGFLGFYQNLPDTMRRIPFGSNPKGTFDNLVAVPEIVLARIGKRDLTLPFGALQGDPGPLTPAAVRDTVIGLALQSDLTPEAAAYIADRLTVYFSSCDERRIGQWDNVLWTEFAAVARFGQDYRRLFNTTFSKLYWGSARDNTSTKIVGHGLEWGVYTILERNNNGGAFVRFLDRPTNEVFIDPWIRLLGRLGVHLRLHHELTGFQMRRGRIAGAHLRTPRGRRTIEADWYVCALPLARARRVFSRAMLDADPRLQNMHKLATGWGNGIKYYLKRPTPIVKGAVIYSDAPWIMTGTSQGQFWPLDFAETYGDGQVKDCMDVVWINFDEPGIVYGKPARECTPDQIAREVWEQMKPHFEPSEQPLTDDLLHSWHIDPGLVPKRGGGFTNEDVLTLAAVGSWQNQPDAGTGIPNFMLAGEYVRGEFEMANMEIANETGRRAANAILDRSRSREATVPITPSYRPTEWEPLKKIDRDRYRRGEPNLFDAPGVAPEISALLHRHA